MHPQLNVQRRQCWYPCGLPRRRNSYAQPNHTQSDHAQCNHVRRNRHAGADRNGIGTEDVPCQRLGGITCLQSGAVRCCAHAAGASVSARADGAISRELCSSTVGPAEAVVRWEGNTCCESCVVGRQSLLPEARNHALHAVGA